MIPEKIDIHIVSSLLKRYFRQMKEPMVPFSDYETFIAIGRVLQIKLRNYDEIENLHALNV